VYVCTHSISVISSLSLLLRYLNSKAGPFIVPSFTMVSYKSFVLLGLLAITDFVVGHGCIIAATGDAGGNGTALGIDSSTPRDGTKRKPFQQDTTRFAGDQADTFGETLEGGDNDPEAGTTAILAESGGVLPQISPGGQVQMTLHQVNTDGAGPYTCMINDDGTGTTWTKVGTELGNVIMSLTKVDDSHTASARPSWPIWSWLGDRLCKEMTLTSARKWLIFRSHLQPKSQQIKPALVPLLARIMSAWFDARIQPWPPHSAESCQSRCLRFPPVMLLRLELQPTALQQLPTQLVAPHQTSQLQILKQTTPLLRNRLPSSVRIHRRSAISVELPGLNVVPLLALLTGTA
jgi:hypothetical protein